jgi:ligand-binding sensor domain-containing protein
MSYTLRLQPSAQVFAQKYYSNCLGGAVRVNCAAADGVGRLYVGTDKGVFRMEENGRFLRLSGVDFNVPALCLLRDGTFAAAC